MQYVGGKFRQSRDFAPAILGFTSNRDAYLEPFVGGGWMLRAMGPHFQRVTAGDSHEDLILLWDAVWSGWSPPSSITEEQYQSIRREEPSALRGFVGFGSSFGGKWFGGYARQKGSNETTFPTRAASNLVKTLAKLPEDTQFVHQSYDEHNPGEGTVVYADPPYATRGVEYHTSDGFDHGKFWETMDEWVDSGAHVFVSEFHAPDHWEPLVVSRQTLTLSANSPASKSEQGYQLDTLWVPKNVGWDLL